MGILNCRFVGVFAGMVFGGEVEFEEIKMR